MPDEVTREESRHNPRRLRVTFINRSYWPDVEATGQLLTELCEDLSNSFDVTVIAGPPNQNIERSSYRRSGWSERNGVKIRRVRCTRLAKGNLLGRALNYVTFVLAATIAAFTVPRPDILIVETDPPLLCFVGLAVQKLRRTKFVVYLQDIYPDLAVALGKLPDNFLVRWLRRAMFGTYRRADRVIVLSRDMVNLLIRSGIPGGQISCIPNWIDTRKVVPIKHDNSFRREHSLDGQFVVMYSGNLGLCQQLEDVVETARILRHRSDIQFLFVGDGALKTRLVKQVTELQLDNVRFLPYQPKEALSQSLSAADLHLVPVDRRVVSCLMPSKLYGILASGTPVLVVAPVESELAQLVEFNQVGAVSPPESPPQMAAAIERFASSDQVLEACGQRARQLAESHYDRAICTASFGKMVQSIANGDALPESSLPASDSLNSMSSVPEPTAP